MTERNLVKLECPGVEMLYRGGLLYDFIWVEDLGNGVYNETKPECVCKCKITQCCWINYTLTFYTSNSVAVTAAGGLLPGGDIVAHYNNGEVIEPDDPITIGQPVHFKCDDPTHYLEKNGEWFLELTLTLFDDGTWNDTQPTACVGECFSLSKKRNCKKKNVMKLSFS